jgi:glucuronate isomerase
MFITENFLLQTEAAERLYHDYAENQPIVDFHSHLPAKQIAQDSRFENLARIWLNGDHYKWRAMRAAGVPERYCTGDASDWEKFEKWAYTVPQTLRNPLYHWTHLELKRPLGINDRLLCPETAKGIWDETRETLSSEEFSCRGILRQMNVKLICTTDDPTDQLEHHGVIAADTSMEIKVLPTFRPDMGVAVENSDEFNAWVERLAEASGVDIKDSFESYMEALKQRHDTFHALGCRLSDHGVDFIRAEEYKKSEIETVFRRIRRGNELMGDEIDKFKSAMLHEFAKMTHARGWIQQFHIGAMRNVNTLKYQALGRDAGFDTMGDWCVAESLARFLDRLETEGSLTKTVLYNLNPAWNDVFATMIGCFQDGSSPGKMQFGSGWWFLDQKQGMEDQLNSLSNHGLLSRFIGMLTDSRSFLSFTRHEYFRRTLCNLLGGEMEQGLLPADFELIGKMVSDICYDNAVNYFKFDLGE